MKNTILAGIIAITPLSTFAEEKDLEPSATEKFEKRVELSATKLSSTKEDSEILRRVYACRISSQLRGYEKTPEFISGILTVDAMGVELEPNKEVVIPKKIITQISESYKKNKKEFDRFYIQSLSRDDFLKKFTKTEIENVIIREAIDSYRTNPELYKLKWKFTFIHPLCEPSSPSSVVEKLPSLRGQLQKLQKNGVQPSSAVKAHSNSGKEGKP